MAEFDRPLKIVGVAIVLRILLIEQRQLLLLGDEQQRRVATLERVFRYVAAVVDVFGAAAEAEGASSAPGIGELYANGSGVFLIRSQPP